MPFHPLACAASPERRSGDDEKREEEEKAKQKRTTATLMDQPQNGCGEKANQSHGRSALCPPRAVPRAVI